MNLLKKIAILVALISGVGSAAAERWTVERANAWYDELPWLVGANFVPSTAINQLEMWQAETFDPQTIDRELGWAASLGMNTMRVFLHDLLYAQDPRAFLTRVDHFLEIADRHGIRIMFVFFDGVWHPLPQLGPQADPTPGLHNSGWLQSPHQDILGKPERHDELKSYVQAVVSRYANDERVLIWDLYNEPDNMNKNSYGINGENIELPQEEKLARVQELLAKAFEWAREAEPSQPLTTGIWGGFDLENLKPIEVLSLEQSDVVSFHTYDSLAKAEKQVASLKELGRPLFCTEYMARGNDNLFQEILPLFYQHEIVAYNWGFVNGRSQTIYPWDSWKKRYTEDPDPWFHDIFDADGAAYSEEEVALIRRLTNR